ncbi:hypothetical protein C9J03_21730 [Photobacterium gaetbulicola]|uniref:Uncharacterized protein n=2 Tax=Photobacterium gaetbulicola TaxID=1295392 RepID=A0A0C5WL19_9GAMM|nr:hypothetical protein [Photobacterium gaetbulicola]AJR07868.1 hypothetical protein H744_2c1189 [Photobacterium gaetbulicola Gung47]KHT61672.1 hypothetical protein RJ45_21405 [Photobacterium gaetbulicola]PSU03182.1 hypothetical protein C9J03_21730 [Photobacterium gaetbulicola]
MASENLSSVITTLLTAPADAVVQASTAQRHIWMKWLSDLCKLIQDQPDNVKKNIIEEHLKLAPTWKMSAQLSLSISMRIASLERTETGVSLGLGIGMIQASGTFGFAREIASESVLQAQAIYNLTNDKEIALKDYLSILGAPELVDSTTINTAVTMLGSVSLPAVESSTD